jgi:hypothetical protein
MAEHKALPCHLLIQHINSQLLIAAGGSATVVTPPSTAAQPGFECVPVQLAAWRLLLLIHACVVDAAAEVVHTPAKSGAGVAPNKTLVLHVAAMSCIVCFLRLVT